MTAPTTVPQVLTSRKAPIDKFGVLTLSGFGVRVRTHCNHLDIEDGVGMERRNFRLPRVGHGLQRLVIIGNDGFVSMAALQWLADQNASLTFLDRYGKLLFVSGTTVPGDARLRRAQALAMANGVGLEICRALIDAKLGGQERVVRERVHDTSAADDVASYRKRLPNADSADAVRGLESRAAASYFGALKDIPILWPKSDIRKIPDYWRTVGNRHSPISGGPRLAVNPVHAILNYCFALLESETRLALTAVGLLPDLGMGLHTDTAYRDSLVFDVMEPVRPKVEAWVLDWITREPLRKADFIELPNGNCRLMSRLCAKLTQTSPTWGKLVAPWAEFVVQRLSVGTRKAPTPLTQQHRREAKGQPSFPSIDAPKPESLCRECGKSIISGGTYCKRCSGARANKRIAAFGDAGRVLGRVASKSDQALRKISEQRRRHAKGLAAWDSSTQPAWLTNDFYCKTIQPRLRALSAAAIRKQIGVSNPYASEIRAGRIPHARHWLALAKLANVGPR